MSELRNLLTDGLWQIIGQGGPVDEDFAKLWGNIASHYKHEEKIMFGMSVTAFFNRHKFQLFYSMNEPHDVPDIKIWAHTAQKAVTAIRKAG